jgi:hypothetical protein
MQVFIAYILKACIASGILYGYYQLVLKNKKFHSYNRFYLLLSVIISLVIPFLNVNWLHFEASQNASLNNLVSNITTPIASQPVQVSGIALLLLGAAALTSAMLLGLLAWRIACIIRIRRTGKHTKMEGFHFIETDAQQAPFSFFNYLFWKRGLSATDIHGEKIFKHELAHITQKHTYDKLFTQVICCICWMNPFYWLIQKELNTIHEFIADAASVEEGDTASFATMLLHAHNGGRYLSPSHTFFNSSIKRRLLMISSSNNTRYSYMGRILALPFAMLLLLVLTVSVKAQADASESTQPVKEFTKAYQDTVPKTSPPAELVKEPVTVKGYKLNKPAKPAPKPASQSNKPVTVTGHKIKAKPAEVAKPAQEAPQEVVVVGYKKGEQPPVAVSAQPAAQSQEVVTVIGYKKPATEPAPATAPAQTAKPVPVVEPKTVTGKKTGNQ